MGKCIVQQGYGTVSRQSPGRGSGQRSAKDTGNTTGRTYSNAGNICSNQVEYGHHMTAYCCQSIARVTIVKVASVPFVTLLSRLGLKASPEKSVSSSGWPEKRLSSR